LLVAGGEEGIVRVFDINQKTILRIFKYFSKPVHTTQFAPNNVHIMAGCDDSTLSCLDLRTGQKVTTMNGHTDVVRSGKVSAQSPDVWVSGSYDHTVRLWDVRTRENINTLNHEAPVEDVLVFPNGTIVASAGGPTVKIWDMLSGRLIHTLQNHQKTITSLALDFKRGRLFSAGLDHLVKIYTTSTYQVTHSMKYSAPILSIGISPAETHLVAGMSDGMLLIKHRSKEQTEFAEEKEKKSNRPKYNIDDWRYRNKRDNPNISKFDFAIESYRRKSLKDYDYFLKTFQYNKAVDVALRKRNINVIVSLFEELMHRKSLSIPLSNRNEKTILPILKVIKKWINHPNYSKTLIKVMNHFLDLYTTRLGQSPVVDRLVRGIKNKIAHEVQLQMALQQTLGALDLFLGATKLVNE